MVGKNLSYFIPPARKLNNPYYHIVHILTNSKANTKFHNIVQQYPQIVFLNPRFTDNPQLSKFCSIITSSNSAFSSCVKTISDEGIGCMGGTHFSVLTFFKGDAKGD